MVGARFAQHTGDHVSHLDATSTAGWIMVVMRWML